MNGLLVVKCPECGKAIEVLDPRWVRTNDLGDAVRRASAEGRVVELAEGAIEVGCDCGPPADPPTEARGRFRLNLKQILLVIAAIAIILTIFRHPISLLTDREMLADKEVLKAAASPWSVYGWLLAGSPIINPKSLSKSPIVILMLLANVALAGLLPFGFGWAAVAGFKRLWRMARDS